MAAARPGPPPCRWWGARRSWPSCGGCAGGSGPASYARVIEVNGQPAAQLSVGDQDAVAALEVRDGKIVSILTVLNPDKLSYLYRQMGGPPVATGG